MMETSVELGYVSRIFGGQDDNVVEPEYVAAVAVGPHRLRCDRLIISIANDRIAHSGKVSAGERPLGAEHGQAGGLHTDSHDESGGTPRQ